MSYTRNAFISYAHIDNQPLTPDTPGWVSVFHATLQTMLSQRMGAQANIWRDDKLRGNDIFSDEILQQFPETAALISVLSPRYLSSEWCAREIEAFCREAEAKDGLVVDNKSRVFKVIKTPVERETALPPVVAQMLGYEFYTLDDGQIPRELDPAYGEQARQDFLRMVYKLAWDVAQLLEKISSKAPSPAAEPQPTIYLAQVARDRRAERDIIEAELKRLNYRVLPDKQLPHDEDEYLPEVTQLLAQSALSIHLIGSAFGLAPDGPSGKSILILQNELAAQRAKSQGMPRVIWLPDGTHGDQPAQQSFIDALHRDADTQFGADLITGDIEQLKAGIRSALSTRSTSSQRTDRDATNQDAPLVYVLCTEQDRKSTLPLLKLLKAQAYDVKLPVFAGDALQVREAHRALVDQARAIVLFYGAGDEAWKFHQQNELKKLLSQRHDRPLAGQFIYLADPLTDDKELLLALEEDGLINGLQTLDDNTLAPLFASLTT